MNIIGKWKVYAVFGLRGDGTLGFTPISEMDEEQLADYGALIDSVTEFTADGEVITRIPVPADQIEAAKAEGYIIEGDYIVVEKKAWEKRDGVIYYDTGTEIELFGEEQDSFQPIEENDDGTISFALSQYTRM